MTTQTKNKPVKTLRDGALKATIWRNETKAGEFYSVTLTRTYKRADESFAETNSFSGMELYKIARLAEKAYSEASLMETVDCAIELQRLEIAGGAS